MSDVGIVDPYSNGQVGQNKDLPPALTQDADATNLNQYWINHAQLIPCMVKAMQQMVDTIEDLQARVQALEGSSSAKE
jgi:hypothetical protein